LSSTLGILDPFIYSNADSPASYKAAGHGSRHFCRLKLEHKAAKHCWRDKHLTRPLINKKK